MLEGRTYVPLLHTRLAEMRAMRELPSSTRALIIPIVKLRPWLTSKTILRAVEVIEESCGDVLYGLDLDDWKFVENPPADKPALVEFCRLFDENNFYSNYYNLVESRKNAVPVLRASRSLDIVQGQLQHARRIDRGLFIKIKPESPENCFEIARECVKQNIENIVFIFDCGWGRDILNKAALCIPLVQSVVDLNPDIEIVIAGSSFPDDFSKRGNRMEFKSIERLLFGEIRRNVNGGNLTYGDWGSTRPPAEAVPMRSVPRIDFAEPNDWICWRSEDGETYQDVAERAVADEVWNGKIGVWGEFMIESTALGEDGCIRSPAMAAAVRVNLHLHRQANFDNPEGATIGDERVGDDL